MNEKIRDQYDSLYTAEKNVFGAGKPVEAVRSLSEHLSGGSVLDLGGGEGRNALYLAKEGFCVSVYDISKVGLARLAETAKDQGLEIATKVLDITEAEIEGTFDAVVLTFVLHHLDGVDALKVITEAQEHTNENGVHILITFTNQGDLYERNRTSGRFYPEEATLRELYNNWDIKELSTIEVTTHARNKQGDRMKNHVISLTAQKLLNKKALSFSETVVQPTSATPPRATVAPR